MWQWFHRQVKYIQRDAELRVFSFKLKDLHRIHRSPLSPLSPPKRVILKN